MFGVKVEMSDHDGDRSRSECLELLGPDREGNPSSAGNPASSVLIERFVCHVIMSAGMHVPVMMVGCEKYVKANGHCWN